MDKIKRLLESTNKEDICLGLEYFFKNITKKDFKDVYQLLKEYNFQPKENLDIYIQNFNIFIYSKPAQLRLTETRKVEVFRGDKAPNQNGYTIIRL